MITATWSPAPIISVWPACCGGATGVGVEVGATASAGRLGPSPANTSSRTAAGLRNAIQTDTSVGSTRRTIGPARTSPAPRLTRHLSHDSLNLQTRQRAIFVTAPSNLAALRGAVPLIARSQLTLFDLVEAPSVP